MDHRSLCSLLHKSWMNIHWQSVGQMEGNIITNEKWCFAWCIFGGSFHAMEWIKMLHIPGDIWDVLDAWPPSLSSFSLILILQYICERKTFLSKPKAICLEKVIIKCSICNPWIFGFDVILQGHALTRFFWKRVCRLVLYLLATCGF